jgi:hypothetical protein
MKNPRENYTAAQLQASQVLDDLRNGIPVHIERVTWALGILGDL